MPFPFGEPTEHEPNIFAGEELGPVGRPAADKLADHAGGGDAGWATVSLVRGSCDLAVLDFEPDADVGSAPWGAALSVVSGVVKPARISGSLNEVCSDAAQHSTCNVRLNVAHCQALFEVFLEVLPFCGRKTPL